VEAALSGIVLFKAALTGLYFPPLTVLKAQKALVPKQSNTLLGVFNLLAVSTVAA
jgi:hypothetical protein